LAVGRAIVVSSPGSVELAEEALDPADVLAGEPVTSAGEIASASLPGGVTLTTGVWRCTAGRMRDVETDETFVVLAGRATITHDGRSHEVGPGDVCVLPEGARTEWTIHEDLTKVFVIAER
jgi:uncharacterized cupin superfamily protein